ncbi:MAG TPA: hypothetical protein VMB21_16240, partial [Candidatus Limnocylindria bacterium]|nr:hypothetical protein [Candidatus Limnocylindria bacterium]
MKTPALLLAAVLAALAPIQAEPAHVALKLVAEGVVEPLSFNPLPDGRALVADQVGYIRLLNAGGGLAGAPVLDLTSRLSQINQN